MARIRTDNINQVVGGHEVVSAFAETHRLARLLQIDQLIEDDRHRLRWRAKGFDYGVHPSDMPMVVRAPDVDDAIILPHQQLVVVVSNVGAEIRRPAILPADHHAI